MRAIWNLGLLWKDGLRGGQAGKEGDEKDTWELEKSQRNLVGKVGQ